MSGFCLYKSKITNKKSNFGLSFNSSKRGSFAIAGKANKALKILITAFTRTGVFELELATFTMEAANEAYEQIAKHLRWNLKKRVPILVYHSHNEFQQNNAVGVYMSEGMTTTTQQSTSRWSCRLGFLTR